jgi:hypothetical protein
VISKWYLMERYSEEALKLRGKYVTGELEISAPCFMPAEVMKVIETAVRSEESLVEISKSLTLYGFRLYPISYMGEKAATLAWENDMDFLEACYVALAEIQRVPLVTADDVLYESLKGKFTWIKHVRGFT